MNVDGGGHAVIKAPVADKTKSEPEYIKKGVILDKDTIGFIRTHLKRGVYLDYLEKKLELSRKDICGMIDSLKSEGYILEWDEDMAWVKSRSSAIANNEAYQEDWNGEEIIRFGIVSDTHINSKCQQLTHLKTMYDIFRDEGINTVYNSGDTDDGCNMRRGQEYEKFNHGLEDQANYIITNYPSINGITTKFITGNHDLSYLKSSGADIGIRISLVRKDMVYLGQLNSTVYLTPNCRMELNHALDGSAFAESYAAQRHVDAIMGGDKPNILIQGHHHKAIYFPYRNIHVLEAGCFQSRTSFEVGKRIRIAVGGWIVECRVKDDGTIYRIKPEFIQFHKMIEKDY